MKKLVIILAALTALAACKTSESAYRAAYERAVAGGDSTRAVESTIYAANRNAGGSSMMVVAGDTFEIRTRRVAVTEGGGGIRESLRPYSVVAGQFKQLFNARSMRNRLADGGYPGAFVVETAEPYYYVVLSSHNDASQAAAAIRALPSDMPVAMKKPCPFILHAAGMN